MTVKRKKFHYFEYSNSQGTRLFSISREDLMPSKYFRILFTGTYGQCAKEMTKGWTKEELAGEDSLVTAYSRR